MKRNQRYQVNEFLGAFRIKSDRLLRPNNSQLQFFRKRKDLILVFLCYVILPFLFYLKSPLSKTILGREDAFFLFLPLKLFSTKSILDFHIPFWNPYNLCGTPFFADIESGLFYPFNWLFFILKPEFALNLNIMFHYTMAGYFTFLFLRYLGCNNISAFFGGVAFMFSGFMLAHKEHVNMMQSAAWLPMMMLVFEKLASLKKINYGLIGCGAGIFSLQVFAGHPQIPLLTGILLFWRLIYYCVFERLNIFTLVISLLFSILISLGICAIVILPLYEYHLLTLRSHMTYDFFVEHSYNPLSFILMFFPYFFGSHEGRLYHESFWGSQVNVLNLSEFTSYSGFAVYFLFLVALFFCIKRKTAGFFLFMILFSSFMMLGGSNPVYKVIYHIPILNLFRSPCRYNLIFNFSMAIFASFGLNCISDSFSKISDRIKKYLIVVCLFSSLILFFFSVFSSGALFSRFITLLAKEPDHLRIIQSHAHSLSFPNPSITIPLVFMVIMLFIFCMPILFKTAAGFKTRFWRGLLLLVMLTDLFFTGFFIGSNDTDCSVIHGFNDMSFIRRPLNDSRHRALLECPVTLRHDEKIAALNPNLNIIHRLRMATGEHYSLFVDEAKRIFNLEPHGHNEDITWLLINNKILSAYAIKYLLLSNKSPALLVPHFLSDDSAGASRPNIMPDLTLQSKDGSWSEKTDPVSLEGYSVYELSFEAEGKNNAPLHASIFSNELDRNILLFSIQEISGQWKRYNRVFITTHPLPNSEFHIYSKSSVPILLRHIRINRLPLKFTPYPDPDRGVYQKIAEDSRSGMVLMENKNALPLAYCVNEVKRTDSFEDFYSNIISITAKDWDPEKTACVEAMELPAMKLGPGPCFPTITSQGPNSIEILTNSSRSHFLVLADTYLPGWGVWIDGEKGKIYKTNGMMKGIYLPEGRHKVVFKYQAPGFFAGLIVTLFAIAVLSLLFVIQSWSLCKRYFAYALSGFIAIAFL